jgi:hypothetical protein
MRASFYAKATTSVNAGANSNLDAIASANVRRRDAD